MASTPVAIVHDYLTQRGGAERVVLDFCAAFPQAPVYTSLFEPATTFSEFADIDVRPMPGLNRLAPLRRNHRLALPLLAPAFSALRVDADVALCSSSGWAHGVRTPGRKVVYCYAPARWLYQAERYLDTRETSARVVLGALAPALRRWDRRVASGADHYLTSSQAVRKSIRAAYGIEAQVVPPPHAMDAEAARAPVDGVRPGFWLTVARLLPYKNIDATLEAFAHLPDHRLVVLGRGPDEARLRALAGPNVHLLTTGIEDAQLRWLYMHSEGLVAVSHEDYGLTPLEAAAFGKPTIALRAGGYLDTVADGVSGRFIDAPEPAQIRQAVLAATRAHLPAQPITAHAARFDRRAFVEAVRTVVTEQQQPRPECP